MPNINDFKLIAKKSERYAELLLNSYQTHQKIEDQKQKERIGFYLLILKSICGIQDILDLKDLITDTEFNHYILGEQKIDDYGVDAVYINEEDRSINLFNFKYREKFKPDKSQDLNDPFISTKFINALTENNTSAIEGKLKNFADSIIEKLNSTDEWKMSLYIVSNENRELRETDENLRNLKRHYGLDIISIGLVQISQYISPRPKAVNAEMTLDIDAIMSFSEDSISSSKSYIIRLPINEVIRITCDDEKLRSQYNLEDVNALEEVSLDYSVLFDNVRGFVVRSKYNSNILTTLKKEPSKFFMYNNGLAIIAKDIEAKPINVNKKVKLKLTSFQVINGGQTLRSIHDFHKDDKENIVNHLSNAQILIRVFKTTDDQLLNNKIAEYTNSQNSISSIDLKSLRSEQIQLEQYLDEHEILYSRKTGDTGLSRDKSYKHQISMERLGQILYSLKGNPHKASNRKKQIFEQDYNLVFGDNNLNISESPDHVKKYFQVKSLYELKSKEVDRKFSDQDVFYILYLQAKTGGEISGLINELEELVDRYRAEESEVSSLSRNRKLIQIGFKDFVDQHFSIA